MKKFVTIFLLCIFHFKCTAQWMELNVGSFNTNYLSGVYAITSDNVIVVGSNGTILKTPDGGVSWVKKPSGTTLNLGEVQFPTPSVGYVTASEGKLLKTTDGGETWAAIDLGANTIFLSLSCVNENLIFLSGIDANSNSILLKSTNGGSTWETIIGSSPQIRLYDIQFSSEQIGYASNAYSPSSSKILKTQDGGKNWTVIDNTQIPFNFTNANVGFYYDLGLYKTTNEGNTFSKITQGSGIFREIFAVDENNVWGILCCILDGDGSSRGIRKISSSDSVNYIEITALENDPQTDMLSMHFANESTGYIVGIKNGKGAVWKNGTGINIPGDLSVANGMVKSFKVYPNPSFDKINISVCNYFVKDFTITLTDMSGKLVYNQNFKNKNDVTIDVKSFAKGTYVITIKTQTQHSSQKLIIQ